MALVPNKSVNEVEYDFYSTRSGLGRTATLNDHAGYGGAKKPVSQMERDWLNAQTGVSSNRLPDMWREAVAGLGVAPVVKMDQNMRIFFLNVA
jgi:hypothetical protein